MFHDKRIVANKQSAARSGVEQPADLSKCFKIMNNIQQDYTVSDLPAKLHPLKRAITEKFNDLSRKGRLSIAANKRNALIDFIANCPSMGTVAVTSDNVQHGFLKVGIVDQVKSRLLKKGKLPDAINGELNLTSLAFNSRTEDNYIEK